MGRFVKGSVVVVPLPFSDLTAMKRRPALVVATLSGEDVILCQITSRAIRDNYAVELGRQDFSSGGPRLTSNARPNRLFTADSGIVLYQVGVLTTTKLGEIVTKIVDILRA